MAALALPSPCLAKFDIDCPAIRKVLETRVSANPTFTAQGYCSRITRMRRQNFLPQQLTRLPRVWHWHWQWQRIFPNNRLLHFEYVTTPNSWSCCLLPAAVAAALNLHYTYPGTGTGWSGEREGQDPGDSDSMAYIGRQTFAARSPCCCSCCLAAA